VKRNLSGSEEMTGERIADGPRSRLTEVFHKISWSQDNEKMTDGGVLIEKKAVQSEYLFGPSNGVGESCQAANRGRIPVF